MDLKERLNQLQRLSVKQNTALPKPEKSNEIVKALGGSFLENSSGVCIAVDKFFKKDWNYGKVKIGDVLKFDGKHLSLVAKDIDSSFDFKKALFLDTETTGLAGGAGTYAFLVGLGYFENENFIIKQLFIRDFDEEKAMLSHLADLLKDFDYLVSYNGKCFDVPLLSTRFTIQRIKAQANFSSHLDLLFPTRRLWKRRIKECNLKNVETQILKIPRIDDIPSHLIPSMYFHYLKTGNFEPLLTVFNHNVMDILALVSLSAHICQVVSDPIYSDIEHYLDYFSLGKIFKNMGDFEKGIYCLNEAFSSATPLEEKTEIGIHLAFLHKRLENWEKAKEIWNYFLENNQPSPFLIYEELAKYYEHKAKDYKMALKLVNRALDSWEVKIFLNRITEKDSVDFYKEKFEHRKKRLLQKIAV